MKSIMPFTWDNQKILVHALVSFGKTQDESDLKDPSLKVITYALKELAVVHPINIMMGEDYTHLLVKGVYTT